MEGWGRIIPRPMTNETRVVNPSTRKYSFIPLSASFRDKKKREYPFTKCNTSVEETFSHRYENKHSYFYILSAVKRNALPKTTVHTGCMGFFYH